MKKQLIIIVSVVAVCLLPAISQAQVTFRFSDLFKQNKKENKNMLQSIVELQVYIEQLRKGYQLVNSGLQTVRAVKNGEFDLHDLYYLSRKQVSPAVRKYPAAAKAVDQSQQVRQLVRQFLTRLPEDTLLSGQDKDFVRSTCSAILADVDSNTADMETLLTDGQVDLTDQQRIDRLELVLQRSTRQLIFSKNFCNGASMLSAGKKSEAAENAVLRNYYH